MIFIWWNWSPFSNKYETPTFCLCWSLELVNPSRTDFLMIEGPFPSYHYYFSYIIHAYLRWSRSKDQEEKLKSQKFPYFYFFQFTTTVSNKRASFISFGFSSFWHGQHVEELADGGPSVRKNKRETIILHTAMYYKLHTTMYLRPELNTFSRENVRKYS